MYDDDDVDDVDDDDRHHCIRSHPGHVKKLAVTWG